MSVTRLSLHFNGDHCQKERIQDTQEVGSVKRKRERGKISWTGFVPGTGSSSFSLDLSTGHNID